MPYFTPPTHEEPIRTRVAPVDRHRLTHAQSIVRVPLTGAITSYRQAPLVSVDITNLIDGRDFFRGGYVYAVDDPTADLLTSSGFEVTPDAGYGIGPYGLSGYGF